MCACCGGCRCEHERHGEVRVAMHVWNMRGGEVGDAVSVCMCSVVAVDMNARDMGR